MRVAGIILVVLGALSVVVAFIALSNGHRGSFGGLGFIALGAFLIHKSNKKKEEEEQRKKWENGEV